MLNRTLPFVTMFALLSCLATAQTKTSQGSGSKSAPKGVHPPTVGSAATQEVSGRTQLEAGKTRTIAFIDGAAEVKEFRLKIEPADRYTLRQTLLRIFWDDADKPAVEVPVGDFFGVPFAPARFASLYLRGEETGSTSTLPMRFRRRMRVELSNRGQSALTSVQWKLTCKRLAVASPFPSLHAQWKRIVTKPNTTAVLWTSEGYTEVLGTALALQSADGDFAAIASDKAQMRFWTGSADTPAIVVTFPKFFDLGSPIPRDAATYPRTGTTLMAQTIGRMAVYGFLDVAAFQSAQDARLEVSFPGAVDVAATTFWLQSNHVPASEPIADVQLKPATFHLHGVIEAESLTWEGGAPTKSQDQGFKTEASGGAIMRFMGGTPTASFPVVSEDVYLLNMVALLRPGSARKYRYTWDNEPFSELYETSVDPLEAETTSLWITTIPLHLKPGTHKIALQPQGSEPLFLDYIELMPSRKKEGVVEVENLIEQAKFSPETKLARNDDDAAYSGNSFLQWENVAANAELSIPMELSEKGNYRLELGAWRDIGSMKLTVKLDGKEIGEVDAFVSNADTNVLPLLVGKIKDVAAGKHTLTLAAQAPKVGKQGKLNFDYYKLTRLAE